MDKIAPQREALEFSPYSKVDSNGRRFRKAVEEDPPYRLDVARHRPERIHFTDCRVKWEKLEFTSLHPKDTNRNATDFYLFFSTYSSDRLTSRTCPHASFIIIIIESCV